MNGGNNKRVGQLCKPNSGYFSHFSKSSEEAKKSKRNHSNDQKGMDINRGKIWPKDNDDVFFFGHIIEEEAVDY